MALFMKKNILSCLLFLTLALFACAEKEDSAIGVIPERILTRGIGGDPETLDPGLAEDVHAFSVLIDTYEGLITETAGGELVPGVAEHWSVSDDARVYTFHLRKNARWSNGDPVTAADFVRAIRRVLDPQTASPYGSMLAMIEGLEARSAQILEIRLATPASHFLAVLALPVAFPLHESGDTSISNGSYTLTNRIPGASIHAQKNQHYWNAETVFFDTVIYLPIVDPVTEFNMFRAGELDITHNIPDAQVAAMLRDDLAEAHIWPSLSLYYLAFDMTGPPLDNAALRQSLSMAIDRRAIVKVLGRGDQPAFSIVPPGVSGYQGANYLWADWSDEERRNVARQLYKTAGYGNNNPLAITLMYDAGGIHETIALAVTAMWRDVLGVDATIEKREWKYFLDSRELRDDWDVMRFAWVGDYNAPNTFLDIFRSGDEQNLAAWSNADFDRLMVEAARRSDPRAASELQRSAEEVVLNDYPIAPIYFYASKHLVDLSIGGFTDNIVDRHASRFLFRKDPGEASKLAD
jgi:oligopeptide transport system substrate-binding protein